MNLIYIGVSLMHYHSMQKKTWGATGKEKGSADALAKVAQDKGTGPNTNPYYKENKKGENYESYDFNNGLKDSSENKRDLKEGKNTEIKDNALVLKRWCKLCHFSN